MNNLIIYTVILGNAVIILIMAVYLKTQIRHIKDEYEEEQETTENLTLDHTVNLTQIEIQCLDQYEQTGIRIPVEIIEDLHALRLTTEEEILSFIEIQRNFWKLENSKKPFKRSKQK